MLSFVIKSLSQIFRSDKIFVAFRLKERISSAFSYARKATISNVAQPKPSSASPTAKREAAVRQHCEH